MAEQSGLLSEATIPPINVYEANTTTATPTGYGAPTYGNDKPEVSADKWLGSLFDANENDASGRNGMVEDRLTGLLGSDSEYTQRVKANSLAAMNGRGVANSSLAIGAGQAAAIDAALPIASQDANTFNQVGLANQASTNRSLSENASAENQARTFNATIENQANLADLQYENTAEQFNAQSANQFALANKDAIDSASANFAQAKNQASLEDASNSLKLLLTSAEEQISNYQTDLQRKTSLDGIASTLIQSGVNAGVFATADGGANWIRMIGELYPDMGLSVSEQLSTEAAQGVV